MMNSVNVSTVVTEFIFFCQYVFFL